jgi:hypothetical protein
MVFIGCCENLGNLVVGKAHPTKEFIEVHRQIDERLR